MIAEDLGVASGEDFVEEGVEVGLGELAIGTLLAELGEPGSDGALVEAGVGLAED